MKLKHSHREHSYFYVSIEQVFFCRKFKHRCSIIVYWTDNISYIVFILSRTINHLCFIFLQETHHRCRKWLVHQPGVDKQCMMLELSISMIRTLTSGLPEHQSKDSPHLHLYYVEDNLLGERPNILLHTWLYSSY